jgi:transcriptional regulator with XRE-family HTH domain
MSINENIKKLRREKNITQEKLAEHLNVSIQAVSKWERSETLPDITMIIPIAGYFGVTTDELLGVDAAKNEAKIQDYLKEKDKLLLEGQWEEAGGLMTKAHREFPNDFRIMNWYIQLLIGGRTDNPADVVLSHADEVTALCERISDECTVDDIRREAVYVLAKVKKTQGKVDEALKLLEKFPDWYSTKKQLSEQLFDKKTDEWWNHVIGNFFELADFALNKLEKIIWHSNKPFDEKVKASLKIIDYLIKILDETDCEMLYNFIALAYSEIGKQHHIAGKSEEVGKYFDIGLSYAMKFDDFVTSEKQSPFYSQKTKQNYADMWSSFGKYNTMLKRQFAWYENNPWFEELRKLDSFSAMLEKYRPFAK